jgi:hypothetical protein
MSFFSRKPNPPTPKAASNAMNRATTGATGPAGWVGPSGSVGVASQAAPEQQTPSNSRFRSFAERYLVERCRDWKEGEIDERAWAAILEAKSIYNKVKEVGRTLGSDT